MEQALLCFGGTGDWPDGWGQFVLCGLRVTEGFPVVLCFTVGCTLRATVYINTVYFKLELKSYQIDWKGGLGGVLDLGCHGSALSESSHLLDRQNTQIRN